MITFAVSRPLEDVGAKLREDVRRELEINSETPFFSIILYMPSRLLIAVLEDEYKQCVFGGRVSESLANALVMAIPSGATDATLVVSEFSQEAKDAYEQNPEETDSLRMVRMAAFSKAGGSSRSYGFY